MVRIRSVLRWIGIFGALVLMNPTRAEVRYYVDHSYRHDFSQLGSLDPRTLAQNDFVRMVQGTVKPGQTSMQCSLFLPAGGAKPDKIKFFLHGLKSRSIYVDSPFGTTGMSYAEYLVKKHNAAVVACDHWGHGFSEGRREYIPDFDQLAQDWMRIVSQMRAFVIHQYDLRALPYDLSGHSMGGAIALHLSKLLATSNEESWKVSRDHIGLPKGVFNLSPAIGQSGIKGALDFISGHTPAAIRQPLGRIASHVGLKLFFFFDTEEFSVSEARTLDLVTGQELNNATSGSKFFDGLREVGNAIFKWAPNRFTYLDLATAQEIAAISLGFKSDYAFADQIPIAIAYDLSDKWVGGKQTAKFMSQLRAVPGGESRHCEFLTSGQKHDTIIAPGIEVFYDRFMEQIYASVP